MEITNEILKGLEKELDYKWRQGPGGKQLPYINARQVMAVLDEVVGKANWQDYYRELNGQVICDLSIKACGEWITKSGAGAQSEIEPVKGAASDAFKRAGVKWGIGRFLYDIKGGPGQQGGKPGQASESQVKRMYAIGYKECGYGYEDIDKALERKGLKKSELTVAQVDQFIKTMQENPKKS